MCAMCPTTNTHAHMDVDILALRSCMSMQCSDSVCTHTYARVVTHKLLVGIMLRYTYATMHTCTTCTHGKYATPAYAVHVHYMNHHMYLYLRAHSAIRDAMYTRACVPPHFFQRTTPTSCACFRNRYVFVIGLQASPPHVPQKVNGLLTENDYSHDMYRGKCNSIAV